MRRCAVLALVLTAVLAFHAESSAQELQPVWGLRSRTPPPLACPPCLPGPYTPTPTDPSRPADPNQPNSAQPNAAQPPTTPMDDGGRGAALASGEGALPNIIGDLLNPDELLPFPLPANGAPFTRALLAARALHAPAQSAGFKIAENENVRPLDRVYGGFNYFNNVNGPINSRLGAPLGQLNAHRETLGVEKTFWDGDASIGLRLPFNTLFVKGTRIPGLDGTFTSVGDLSIIVKRALWEERPGGTFVSGGLLITTPTGQESFGGGGFLRSPRNVILQPFVGYILPFERIYLQGFTSVAAPVDWARDVVMLFNDLSVGWKLYRDPTSDRFVTAATPILEMHLNTPLNHRGALSGSAGTPDSFIFTEGVTLELRRRAQLTLALAEPVTGFKPFDFEAVVQLNWRY